MLLIDEIDKADIEFPNDLLRELDRMEFYVYETRETVHAKHRPVIVITSNNEKELPDAFLRRCFFHYIRFPDEATMTQIIDVHFPGLKRELLREALATFFKVRDTPGLKKKPTTSELLDWIKLLVAEDISARGAAQRRCQEAHSAAVRRAAEERAGRAPVRAAAVPQPPECSLGFSSAARRRRAGVDHRIADPARGACRRGLGDVERGTFYYLARACLVKDERYYDRFDRAFAAHFKGAEELFAAAGARAARRLARRRWRSADFSEEEKAQIEALGGWDKLMETLKKRLEEQQERHEGGNKWIGTARHLAVRRVRLQPRRRAHRPGRDPAIAAR